MIFLCIPDTRDLNIEAVSFLIYGTLYYLQNGFSSAYNPYWIFASEHYKIYILLRTTINYNF